MLYFIVQIAKCPKSVDEQNLRIKKCDILKGIKNKTKKIL